MSDDRRTVAQHLTPPMIRDREGFKASALTARVVDGLGAWDSGQLRGPDLDTFRTQCLDITYVVYSYSTPIAWWSKGYGWHKAEQEFSATTSKHQGKLYLIP